MIDGLVFRFVPEKGDLPMGQLEGSFIPCRFWLAAVYALMGRKEDGEKLLDRTEQLTGNPGLFSEEVESSSGMLLGNIPMIFSHAEYARVVLQLANIWPRSL